MFFLKKNIEMPAPENALPGRAEPIATARHHFVNGAALKGPYNEPHEKFMVGMGCFWGAERMFWQLPNVLVTAVGYSAGFTPNPTYEEVCSGRTGHNEVVLIVYNSEKIGIPDLLKTFWENHNPTQGMAQGNDTGTQYRSGLYYYSEEQHQAALASKQAYQKQLSAKGYGAITTEIKPASEFYFAEDYHQQYLAKNPQGYCGLGGTGIACPIGIEQAVK